MYVALGKEKSVFSKDIVAIFDLDITSQSHLTRRFLREAEKAGNVENTAECKETSGKGKINYGRKQ